ncbi:MAG: Nif11-like leader peptide family natural product precursor [Rikenellaceae bacterium]
MSINNAINFMHRVQSDTDFRHSCYRCKNHEQLMEHLKTQGLSFTEEEFENGCNMLHIKCADESEAYALHEIKSWYSLFL